MNFMVMQYLHSFFREVLSRFIQVPSSIHYKIPYYSQFASAHLVDKILSDEIDPEDDPQWKQSGAKTKQEYAYWSHNTCGMACMKMVLKYKLKKEFPIVTLAKKCTEYGGYVLRNNFVDGLFYEPFCRFVKKEFHLDASVAPFLSLI